MQNVSCCKDTATSFSIVVASTFCDSYGLRALKCCQIACARTAR